VKAHDQRQHKIPQLGIVVLEDFVEFGANCAVDRATLGETRIGEGTKFDNLCHVAHNCQIGRHSVYAAGFFVAGSSTIGDHFMVGGTTAVGDHLQISDNVTLGGRSVVTSDIPKAGAYAGYPLEPFAEARRTLVNLTYVTKMRKQLLQIQKHLGLKEE